MKHALALAAVFALALTAFGAVPRVDAQGPLLIGGTRANFGVYSLTGGFLPDPATYTVTSGGSMPVADLSLAPGCRGFVTPQPDVIVRYQSPASFVRFFVRAGGDTTLVINDASGHWWCDDDSGGNRNPMIDIASPPGGQYDIWVGSYRASELVPGQLFVTEVRSTRP